jgi:transcription initiation factor TFIIIB Brf1 subunit/transcription initiation factor TFIIB
MSGGAFQYNQYKIGQIAEDIQQTIDKNGLKLDEDLIKENKKWYGNDYYERFPEELYHYKYPDNVIEKFKEAVDILKKAEISELTSGRGPAGIAAAALYVAALLNDEKKTQREVADVAGITEVTIRNRYKELLDRLDLEDKIKIKESRRKGPRHSNEVIFNHPRKDFHHESKS